MYTIIGTWKMVYPGLAEAARMLKEGVCAGDAVVHAVRRVEDDPELSSVGYGGLPDREGRVFLDAAYMDGNTLQVGAVLSAENIANPILAARLLCGRKTDCILAGRGAERFAVSQGLPTRDMRTESSMKRWRDALTEKSFTAGAYRGHDTVCVLALDGEGRMAAGTSTSGLFMKEPGRVGDTPLIGSGFYADARYGAAAATGLGEDIMRGCLSYEAVSLMRRGASPEAACREALARLADRLTDVGEVPENISMIALSPDGAFGAATTMPVFPFAVGNGEGSVLYAANIYTDPGIHVAGDEEIARID